MGILDGIVGNVVGSSIGGGATQAAQDPLGALLRSVGGAQAQGNTNLMAAAMSLLQQHGGLGGVLDMFRQNGMASHADSWVSTGTNMDITGDQVQRVFGASSLGSVASQLGMPQAQAGTAIAQILPQVINQLTPQGQLPANSQDLIAKGLAMLRGAV